MNGGVDIRSPHHKGNGLQSTATHRDDLLLAYHREVAAGRQDIAQSNVHVTAESKQLAFESQLIAVAVAIGHKQWVLTPVQGRTGISQPHVDVQSQVLAAQAQAIGFGAHQGQLVNGSMQAQPAVRIMGSNHQSQLQTTEFETECILTGRGHQACTEAGAPHDQQVGVVQSSTIRELDGALFALKLRASAEAHRITQAGIHCALDQQQHTVAALHVKTDRTVRPRTYRHRCAEVDDMRGLALTGLETADLINLHAKVAARKDQTRYTDHIGCFHRSGQGQPGRIAVLVHIGRGRLNLEQGQAKVGIAH